MSRISNWMLDKAQGISLAVFLATQFSLNSLYSPLLLIGWVALAGASVCKYLAPNKIERPLWVLGALLFLQMSQLTAIPGAAIWGNGNWVLTAGVFLWVLPMPLVYLTANQYAERWICLFGVIHALFIIFQGFTDFDHASSIVWFGSPQGFSHNPNIAAGLLILCLPFAIRGNLRWALIPLLTAIIFTNSRWAFIVASILVMAMGYKNVISIRWVLVGLGSLLSGIGLMGSFTPVTASVASFNSISYAQVVAENVAVRLSAPDWPNLLPYGIAETNGLHNVPMRMAAESGVISAVVWVSLSVWALCRMRFSPAWWLMVSILLLSVLDHYTWRPHLMGFWFVALGILAVQPSKDDDHSSIRQT
jgi:hypothetical protein